MPSPLASIYSAADSFKRGLLDAVQNPVDKMRQVIGDANDRAGVLNALSGQAADQTMASIKSGGSFMPDTPESRQLTQMMVDAYNPMGLTVFHGSPYKFNAFAPKAIGSGEGAQAYGYGHYLAENPSVAKEYQANRKYVGKALAGAPEKLDYGPDWIAKNALDVHGDDAISHLEGVLKMNLGSKNKRQIESNEDVFKAIDLLKSNKFEASGNLYKVDLPDEQISKMLDWDAEISKQTPEVQALAQRFKLAPDDLGGDLVAAMNAKQVAGAEQMRQAGIPGIRYYDAQSRGGQKADTRNFVVFPGNEGLLKILERNGVPLE